MSAGSNDVDSTNVSVQLQRDDDEEDDNDNDNDNNTLTYIIIWEQEIVQFYASCPVLLIVPPNTTNVCHIIYGGNRFGRNSDIYGPLK
jgi:hypothetical protein